jgi:hypothetical protein
MMMMMMMMIWRSTQGEWKREACRTYGTDEKFIQYFGWKERDHLEDLGVDG